MRTIVRLSLVVVASFFLSTPAASNDRYHSLFTEKTMRVDYFHSGTQAEEHISPDRVVMDGIWPGSRTRLIDDSNLGKYLFEVIDRQTNAAIYSRGFASIYGEWETTPEARTTWKTFHESLRFPWPRRPVQVVLKKRAKDNSFTEIWNYVIDPASRQVVPAYSPPRGKLWSVFQNGQPDSKVDLLVLGDGYTPAEIPKYQADVKRLVDALFKEEPFRSRKSDFNVWGLDLPSDQSGVSRPHAGVFRRTPLSTHYSSFDSERYVLTYDNRNVRDIASAAPYDIMAILLNERTYGGGGIFNLFFTCSSDNAYANYIFVHEFGHHFAGLGDEYYTSDVAYETGATEHVEPWEPNVTALHAPGALKWKHLVEDGTPLPTPWEKEKFEEASRKYQKERARLRSEGAPESEMERLFTEQEKLETEVLRRMKYFGKVGAFEGASYEQKGLYRPSIDCIMFSRNKVGFCPVCRAAIERVIDLHVGK